MSRSNLREFSNMCSPDGHPFFGRYHDLFDAVVIHIVGG